MSDDPMITLCEETIRMLIEFMGMHGVRFGRLARSVRGTVGAKARIPTGNVLIDMIVKTSPRIWPSVEMSFYKKRDYMVGRAREMLDRKIKSIDVTNGFDEVLEAWNDVWHQWKDE